MAITKVKSGVRTLGTGEVVDANIATDAVTTAKVLDNNITIAKISGSASASAGTYLKQDGTWASVGGAATEMYSAASAPGSPIAGSLWFDTVSTKAKVYDGTDWLDMAAAFSASGGTITTYTGYQIHSFTASGSLTVTGAARAMDFLIVAGGGGGGSAQGGGGGGGGMRVFSGVSIDTGAHIITIGGGGTHGTNVADSQNGGDSSFEVIGGSTYTSTGGGRGGSYNSHPGSNSGSAGGSGGGGGSGHLSAGTGGAGNTPSTTPSQGAGGYASATVYSEMGSGGGGGGASGVTGAGDPATGGNGTENSYRIDSNVYYAGGGAGRGASARAGGSGGGGATATSGTANTGGGGGGGSNDTNSGYGGSGIIVIRYAV